VSRDCHFGFSRWLILCGLAWLWASCASLCVGDSLVVEVEGSNAMSAFEPNPDVVRQMVSRGMLKVTGKADLKSAFLSILSPSDVVGIKVYSAPGRLSGTRPAVVEAVVVGLLQAGWPPSNIVVWDKHLSDLRQAGYLTLAEQHKIRVAGATETGYDEKVSYDNPLLGTLIAGDLEFELHGKTSGRLSYVTKLLTQDVTKIITISPLLNHNMAGVCGNLYSLATGSADNTLRFENNGKALSEAVPELYAMRALSDHVVLSITDALICQYQGEQLSLLHYSTELNQIWFSKDPVALDKLSVMELNHERDLFKIPPTGISEKLLENAADLLQLGVCDPAKIRLEIEK
jgi:hypothetical protein